MMQGLSCCEAWVKKRCKIALCRRFVVCEDNNTRKPTDEEAESIDMTTSCSEEESETRKGSLGQVTKYFGVSFTQTFVEFGVFAFFEAVGLSFGISNTLAVICSGAYNFMMNRSITFKASSNFTRSVILFVLLYAWNLVFGNVMLGLLPGMLGISTTIVKALCMCCQGIWGYLLCKHVIFV